MKIHTVREGESLYDIAKDYGVAPTKIIENNGIKNPDKLPVGRELLILTPTRTYTVRGGDTLDKVARCFGVSESALLRVNPYLSQKNMTYPEQVIAIRYDAPRHGSVIFNGCYYKGTSDKRLAYALCYADVITVSVCVADGRGLEVLFDDAPLLEKTASRGRAAVMRVYMPHGFESYRDGAEHLARTIAERAGERGYTGVSVAAYKSTSDPDFGKFLLTLKRELMLGNMVLNLECERPDDMLTEIADSTTLVYDKCAEENIPSFDMGERRVYTEYANLCDSTRCYIDLSPFAYAGGEAMTRDEAYELAARSGKEIRRDTKTGTCRFDYKRVRGGRMKETAVVFESLENVKAKLELISELGFMGVSFDIMRAPTDHLMMSAYTFGQVPPQPSAEM